MNRLCCTLIAVSMLFAANTAEAQLLGCFKKNRCCKPAPVKVCCKPVVSCRPKCCPAPKPCCPAPAPTCCPAPAPAPAPCCAPAPMPAPAPCCAPAPAPAPCCTPAPAPCCAPKPVCCKPACPPKPVCCKPACPPKRCVTRCRPKRTCGLLARLRCCN